MRSSCIYKALSHILQLWLMLVTDVCTKYQELGPSHFVWGAQIQDMWLPEGLVRWMCGLLGSPSMETGREMGVCHFLWEPLASESLFPFHLARP